MKCVHAGDSFIHWVFIDSYIDDKLPLMYDRNQLTYNFIICQHLMSRGLFQCSFRHLQPGLIISSVIGTLGSSTIRLKVSSEEQTLALISNGAKYRATTATNLNERSSRSHTIITLEIVRQIVKEGTLEGDVMGN